VIKYMIHMVVTVLVIVTVLEVFNSIPALLITYCVLTVTCYFQKCEGVLQPEYRKFSVDPQITSFEVLQSILAKAFDIRGFV
jgi:hypothetical protein